MKSAIKIIIFSKSDPAQAIASLLELAIEALDATGYSLPAAHVEMRLHTYFAQYSEKAKRNFDGGDTLQ